MDVKFCSEFLDYTAAGIFLTDENFVIVFWNKVLEKWTKIKREEVIGSNLFSLYPNLRKSRFKTRLNMVCQGGPPQIFSPQLHPNFIPCSLKSGELMIQQTIVNYIQTKDEELKLLNFTITDMSLLVNQMQTISKLKNQAQRESSIRKELAIELETREKLFKSQYKNIPIPTYTWKKHENDFYLSDFNNAAIQSDNDIFKCHLGIFAKDLFSSHKDIQLAMTNVYCNKESDTRKYSYRAKDKMTHFQIKFAFVEPDYLMMHAEDITDEKEFEKAKRDSAALKSAMAIVTTTSHEINQPLMVIQSAIEMLEIISNKEELSENQQKYLNKVKSSSFRIQALINKLRNIKEINFKEYVEEVDMVDIDY